MLILFDDLGGCFFEDPAHLQGDPHTLHQDHKIKPLQDFVPDHASQCTKVNVPNLAANVNQAPIFEWCMVRLERTQKDVFLIEIGLQGQYLLTILVPLPHLTLANNQRLS